MRTTKLIFFYIGILSLSLSVGILAQNKYTGNHPYISDIPITSPKIFEIPGIGKDDFAANITFSPDGKELYFVSDSSGIEIIKFSRFVNGKWSKAKTTGFSGKYRIETPHVSPDGNKFFFSRPTEDYKNSSIYVMEKKVSGWSEPKLVDSTINDNSFNAGPSCTINGNMYFFTNREGSWKVFCSRFVNGKYSEPIVLDSTITKNNISELYISPDESYLLFGGYVSKNNVRDIYISFRINNSWTNALSLGSKINTNDYEGRPCISPDGNYLFFTKGNPSKIYRIDWKPIFDSLRYQTYKYLGQPLIFSEGIVNGSGPAFTKDGNTVYTHKWEKDKGHTIYVSNFVNGSWMPERVAEFSGKYDELEPFIYYDGSKLFFYSMRPSNLKYEDGAIWFMEKSGKEWSQPEILGAPITIPGSSSGVPAISKNGNLYFGSTRRNNKFPWEIYFSKFVNGKYEDPININDTINKNYLSWSHCIDPNENFLIFCSERPDGFGDIDLYISFKIDTKWTPGVNLGPKVNTGKGEVWPRLSNDGKYLFFNRQGDEKKCIYQVDVEPLINSLNK